MTEVENNVVVEDDDLDDEVDINLDDEDEVIEDEKPWKKFLDWIKNHKKEVAIGAGATTLGLVLGNVLKKPEIKEVEKLPDPTIMDKYDRIPVEEHTYTDYKYVLKPEYQDEE